MENNIDKLAAGAASLHGNDQNRLTNHAGLREVAMRHQTGTELTGGSIILAQEVVEGVSTGIITGLPERAVRRYERIVEMHNHLGDTQRAGLANGDVRILIDMSGQLATLPVVRITNEK